MRPKLTRTWPQAANDSMRGLGRLMSLAFIGLLVSMTQAAEDEPPPAQETDTLPRQETNATELKETTPTEVPRDDTAPNLEPEEITPLIPIKTKNTIRANANVSFPQDI